MGIYLSNIYKQNIHYSKKAIRIITHSPFQCHSSPLFKKTSNLNIFQIIEYYASIFMFQKLNSTVPNVFQQNRFLSYSYHAYETRNNLSIRTPLFKLQFSKRSIFDHGIKIWNNLSPEVKSITNKSIFKKIIRKKLINETAITHNNKGCFPLIALLCYTKHDVQRQYRQFV